MVLYGSVHLLCGFLWFSVWWYIFGLVQLVWWGPGENGLVWYKWYGRALVRTVWFGKNSLLGPKIDYLPTCYLPSCIRRPLQVMGKVHPPRRIKRNQASSCKKFLQIKKFKSHQRSKSTSNATKLAAKKLFLQIKMFKSHQRSKSTSTHQTQPSYIAAAKTFS